MDFMASIMGGTKIGAAIRRVEDLEEAVRHPGIKTIFLLGGDINYLPGLVKKITGAGKVILVHVDLMDGIGKDRAGIRLIARMGVSGIVTTKSSLVKHARNESICAIQRLFIMDSESIKTAIRVAGSVMPAAVEILPATVPKYVIDEMKKALGLPVLGGGLLRTQSDVREALAKGMDAVSSSLRELWNISI